MDLSKMMTKIDQHKYESVLESLADVDLITRNALEYNPNRDQTGAFFSFLIMLITFELYHYILDQLIRHRACALRDVANDIIDDELDSDFEAKCIEMKEFRSSTGKFCVWLQTLKQCNVFYRTPRPTRTTALFY
jgi:ATPase family AAA domain-containing protein 2